MTELPIKSLGVYCAYWDSPKFATLDPHYNTVYLFSARPVGGQPGSTGAVFFDYPQDTAANLQAYRALGKTAILSIGGAGEFIDLSTRARSSALVASIETLFTQWRGFDGIDWDIESDSLYPTEMAWVSQQLKLTYGPNFAITYAAAPWRAMDQQVVQALYQAGVLDLVSPQYYDLTGLSTEQSKISNAVSSIEGVWAPLVNHDYSKLGFGFETTGESSSNTMTVASCVSAWNTVVAAHPSLRGAFCWESAQDASIGYAFAQVMAPVVLTNVPAPTPVPTPAPATDNKAYIQTASRVVNGFDIPRLLNYLVVYTLKTGTVTTTNQYGTEVTIINGVVTSVVDRAIVAKRTGTAIPANGVVLSGHGTARTWLNAFAKVGVPVKLPVLF